jgi:CDP-paratose 2-epimerase
MGGSRHSNCSVLEAIDLTQELCGKELSYTLSDQARSGDHIWWISDVKKFQDDYPEWSYQFDLRTIVQDIVDATQDRQVASSG